ncbi:hypothetical protein FNV43_RR10070 [Rhamnella rubrinervis]|uniref:TIR domain-containing protein n=1 Tax=Rhamnella rubrinervis TaxID=2594499 RepID=A0A8K0HB50_9ROSA|nr:hypothetical protein FNV43_RR10070 [Rhamnella rubrinervis]
MASSSPSREKHDVFISFRGEDTRDGFASFLYEALRDKAIQAYMDDHQLQRGDEILTNPSECLIGVQDFIVIPVFYGIHPSIVRKQKESYADAFAKHEERLKDKMEKVNQWRGALKEAANLSGLHSNQFR